MRAALLIVGALATGCSSNDALLFAVAMNSIPSPEKHPTPQVTEVQAKAPVRRDGAFHVAVDLKFIADHPVTDVLVQVLETRSEEMSAIAPPHARSGVAHVNTKLPNANGASAYTLRLTLIDSRGVTGTPVIKKIALL